tara:strand:- start:508 stop:816 length:309 start_codon:yes stop_codon:yes gene_type:complete
MSSLLKIKIQMNQRQGLIRTITGHRQDPAADTQIANLVNKVDQLEECLLAEVPADLISQLPLTAMVIYTDHKEEYNIKLIKEQLLTVGQYPVFFPLSKLKRK